jgi:hypothetical protein
MKEFGRSEMKNIVLGICAVLAVTFSAALFAGDGIPMGDAVFYPSVEAIYSHTDNLFLQDKSEPGGLWSDSYWAIRPTLGFEFPFKQSYVRFNLGYQYKDYDKYDLTDHNTWLFDFDSKFKFSNNSVFTLRDHFLQGVQELQKVDPGYEATFGNEKFDYNEFQAGYDFDLNQHNAMGVFGNWTTVDFSNKNTQAQPFYGYDQISGGLNWKYHLNATNNFLLQYTYLQSKPDQSYSTIWLASDPYRKYNSNELLAGWEGSVNRYFSGYAKAGYRKMSFTQNNYADFSGVVLDSAMKFNFTDLFKLDLNLYRLPYQSAYNVNNYYVTEGLQAQLHQQVTRYFFWSAGYLYQQNSYPNKTLGDVNGDGFIDDPTGYMTQGQKRRDDISRVFGELGFHVTRQLSMRVNYQHENRDCNIHYWDVYGVQRHPFSYTEDRFTFQAQLGW